MIELVFALLICGLIGFIYWMIRKWEKQQGTRSCPECQMGMSPRPYPPGLWRCSYCRYTETV